MVVEHTIRFPSDQSIHIDSFGLTYPMGPGLGLQIILRIPVTDVRDKKEEGG